MAMDRQDDAVFMYADGGHDPPREGESSCLLLDVAYILICSIVYRRQLAILICSTVSESACGQSTCGGYYRRHTCFNSSTDKIPAPAHIHAVVDWIHACEGSADRGAACVCLTCICYFGYY
jgi:hypothetical protein